MDFFFLPRLFFCISGIPIFCATKNHQTPACLFNGKKNHKKSMKTCNIPFPATQQLGIEGTVLQQPKRGVDWATPHPLSHSPTCFGCVCAMSVYQGIPTGQKKGQFGTWFLLLQASCSTHWRATPIMSFQWPYRRMAAWSQADPETKPCACGTPRLVCYAFFPLPK